MLVATCAVEPNVFLASGDEREARREEAPAAEKIANVRQISAKGIYKSVPVLSIATQDHEAEGLRSRASSKVKLQIHEIGGALRVPDLRGGSSVPFWVPKADILGAPPRTARSGDSAGLRERDDTAGGPLERNPPRRCSSLKENGGRKEDEGISGRMTTPPPNSESPSRPPSRQLRRSRKVIYKGIAYNRPAQRELPVNASLPPRDGLESLADSTDFVASSPSLELGRAKSQDRAPPQDSSQSNGAAIPQSDGPARNGAQASQPSTGCKGGIAQSWDDPDLVKFFSDDDILPENSDFIGSLLLSIPSAPQDEPPAGEALKAAKKQHKKKSSWLPSMARRSVDGLSIFRLSLSRAFAPGSPSSDSRLLKNASHPSLKIPEKSPLDENSDDYSCSSSDDEDANSSTSAGYIPGNPEKNLYYMSYRKLLQQRRCLRQQVLINNFILLSVNSKPVLDSIGQNRTPKSFFAQKNRILPPVLCKPIDNTHFPSSPADPPAQDKRPPRPPVHSRSRTCPSPSLLRPQLPAVRPRARTDYSISTIAISGNITRPQNGDVADTPSPHTIQIRKNRSAPPQTSPSDPQDHDLSQLHRDYSDPNEDDVPLSELYSKLSR